MRERNFLEKYILHHWILGLSMYIEGIFLLKLYQSTTVYIIALLYIFIGLGFFFHDLLWHLWYYRKTEGKYFQEPYQPRSETVLDEVGLKIWIFSTITFIYLSIVPTFDDTLLLFFILTGYILIFVLDFVYYFAYWRKEQ